MKEIIDFFRGWLIQRLMYDNMFVVWADKSYMDAAGLSKGDVVMQMQTVHFTPDGPVEFEADTPDVKESVGDAAKFEQGFQRLEDWLSQIPRDEDEQ